MKAIEVVLRDCPSQKGWTSSESGSVAVIYGVLGSLNVQAPEKGAYRQVGNLATANTVAQLRNGLGWFLLLLLFVSHIVQMSNLLPSR